MNPKPDGNPSHLNEKFARAILLKISFRPGAMFKSQAFLIYAALAGQYFTADVIPLELRKKEDGTTDCTTQGAAVSMLQRIGLITCIGRVTSPAASRNGSEVKKWRLADGKRSAALAWLDAQNYPRPDEQDGDFWTLFSAATKADRGLGYEYDDNSASAPVPLAAPADECEHGRKLAAPCVQCDRPPGEQKRYQEWLELGDKTGQELRK